MCLANARLAQSGERKSYKLDVVGSTPTLRTRTLLGFRSSSNPTAEITDLKSVQCWFESGLEHHNAQVVEW